MFSKLRQQIVKRKGILQNNIPVISKKPIEIIGSSAMWPPTSSSLPSMISSVMSEKSSKSWTTLWHFSGCWKMTRMLRFLLLYEVRPFKKRTSRRGNLPFFFYSRRQHGFLRCKVRCAYCARLWQETHKTLVRNQLEGFMPLLRQRYY